MRTKRLRTLAATAVTALGMLAWASPAWAATFAVTNTNDSGAGSLRAAVIAANANAGPDAITFDIPESQKTNDRWTINLTSELPALSDPVNLNGPGADQLTVRRDATENFRVFGVHSGVTATISGLTAANGRSREGGGVYNSGTLTLDGVTVENNTAENNLGFSGFGGGVFNSGTLLLRDNSGVINNTSKEEGGGVFNRNGTVTISGSTVSSNTARFGGGVFVEGGTVDVSGSTIGGDGPTSGGNKATTGNGGGVYVSGGALNLTGSTVSGNDAQNSAGVFSRGAFTATNSTISTNAGPGLINQNTATLTNVTIAANTGTGLTTSGGTVEIKNTLLAENGVSCVANNGGSITSNGNNLKDDDFPCGFGASDLNNRSIDASNFGPLADNGGPTKTHALRADNPAQDAGDDAVLGEPLNLTTDQRGEGHPRKKVAGVNIWAFELANTPDTTITSGPSGPTDDTTPTFDFSSNDPGPTFECRLGSDQFAPCISPFTAPDLPDGDHTFEVRAVNAEGPDPSPPARRFTVDTRAPTPTLTAPTGTAHVSTPAFSGMAGGAAGDRPEISVKVYDGDTAADGALRATLSASREWDGSYSVKYGPGQLPDGSYTAVVEQSDAAGNTGRGGPSTFTVDTAPPTAADDSYSTNEDTPMGFPKEVGLLANDTHKYPLRVEDADPNRDGMQPASGPSHGTLTLFSDGSFRYAPDRDFNGTDTFDYRAVDEAFPRTKVSALARVTISVKPLNDAPSFAPVSNRAVDEDAGPQTVTPFATDIRPGPTTDEASQNVRFEVSDDNAGLFAPGGRPAISSNGTLAYTPARDASGSATVTVVLRDDGGTPDNRFDDLSSDPRSFRITVRAVNDAPSFTLPANPDQTVEEGSEPQTVPGLATNISAGPPDEAGQGLSFEVSSNNATLFADGGGPAISPDGTLTYTPAPGARGRAEVTVVLEDDGPAESLLDNGRSAPRTFGITVNAFNAPPVAVDDDYGWTTPEDNPLYFYPDWDLLPNDRPGPEDENGQTLSIGEVRDPVHGMVSFEDGLIIFVPDPGYNGPASFGYTVCDDGSPSKCSVGAATVNITVAVVNSRPEATNRAYAMDEDGPPLQLDLAGLVSDAETADENLSYEIVSGPTSGKLTGTGATRTFEPAPDFNGTVEFSYKVADRGDPDACGAPGDNCAAPEQSAISKVEITVRPVNDAPVADEDAEYATREDEPLRVGPALGVLEGDTDGDGDGLAATVKTAPQHGALTLDADGSFSYTPNRDFNGTDTFVYTAADGAGGTDEATATISVSPVNDAPVARDDAYATARDTPLIVEAPGILSNDPDVEGDAPAAALVSGPANGTLSLQPDGSFRYAPNTGFTGTDSFTYKASDGTNEGNTATVGITVSETPDTTAPTVLKATPAGARVAPAANVTASFSEAMNRSTLNRATVKLVKRGTKAPIAARITAGSSGTTVTLNPTRSLVRGATYTATITTGAKDLAGNPLAKSRVWSFTVRR